MALRKVKMPARCCGRCAHGEMRPLPEPSSPRYDTVRTFNKSNRVCGRIEGGRVYPAWERNRCRQFEERVATDGTDQE